MVSSGLDTERGIRLSTELENYLQARKALIENFLDQYLPKETTYPERIHQAIRYSVFSGGKRIRPILLLASYEIFQRDLAQALPFACGVELIHSYSLIHDDLPAMDDDDFRRGKPSCHKIFGEATAILAGDALLTEAFVMMARAGLELGLGSLALEVILELGQASGLSGIITGQELDLEKQGEDYDEEDLKFINEHKTAALIRASVRAGGILGRAEKRELKALSEFGQCLGLAFQIIDDILDFQETEVKKEPVRSDTRKKKATYPALLGLNQARDKAKELSQEAIEKLSFFPERARWLRAIAQWLLGREY